MSNKTKTDKKTSNYTYDKFVATWVASNSVSQVADALGISKNTASRVAMNLRKAGVQLPKFPTRVPREIDVTALNKSIARVRG